MVEGNNAPEEIRGKGYEVVEKGQFGKTFKVLQELTEEESKEVLPEVADIPEEANLDEMQIIWIDPQVNITNNQIYQEELQNNSNIKLICYEKSEELRNLMKTPEMERDFLLISEGSIYEEIKELVEESKRVRVVTIFDINAQTFKHFEEHPKVIAVTDSFPQIMNILKNLESYFSSQIVWFDPEVNEGEKKYLGRLLQKSSEKCVIRLENGEEVKELLNNRRTVPNIVIVSSGAQYKDIREVVEGSEKARMVIIVSKEQEKDMHYKREHMKVWDVVENMGEVVEGIREGWMKYIRHQRFGEEFTERTFYGMEDYEFLMQNISLMTSVHEGINIFYPLGFSVVYKQRIPALQNELLRVLSDLVPLVMEEDIIEGQNMRDRLNDLLSYIITPAAILRSYTKEGLYLKFNEYLRSGEGKKVAMFREFAFFLRGSMSHLGIPITNANTKVYRGFTLPIHFAHFWNQNKGKLILLPSYTSTSQKLSVAQSFIQLQGVKEGERKVLLEITFIDNQDIFLQQMDNLTKEEELYLGLYHGVDIAKHSVLTDEAEVLLPPLYPLLIREIEQSIETDKMLTVRCVAPLVLSFGQPRGWLCSYAGGWLGEEGQLGEAIVNKMIKLLKFDILTTLDLSLGGIKNISLELFKELVKAIIPSKNLVQINFKDNYLKKQTKLISEILKNNQTIKKIDLSGNFLDANVIAQGLKNREESLFQLKIGENNFGGKEGMIICKALKTHTLLQEISFCSTDLRKKAAGIAKILKSFKELKLLDVRKTNLSGEGMRKIVAAIANHPLQHLDLGENHQVGGKEMMKICKLLTHIPRLTFLNLSGTGCDHHQIALPLSQLFLNSTSMEELNLDWTNIESEGYVRIVQALRLHKNLKSLKLLCTDIEMADMSIIIKELGEHHKALCTFSIELAGQFSQFSSFSGRQRMRPKKGCALSVAYVGGGEPLLNFEDCAKTLAQAIVQFKGLKSLGLAQTFLENEEDIELIMNSLLQLRALNSLTLQLNAIGNNTELIGELLKSNRSPLRVLTLTNCEIEDKGGRKILEGLRQNTTLKKLDLENNYLSPELQEEFTFLAHQLSIRIGVDQQENHEPDEVLESEDYEKEHDNDIESN